MDLPSRKITFVQKFLKIEDEETLDKLEKLLHEGKSELYEKNLQPMNLEDFNNEIDRSLKDCENDNVISARDLKKKAQKWF